MTSKPQSASLPFVEYEGEVRFLRDQFVFNKRTGAFFSTNRVGAYVLLSALKGQGKDEIEKSVAREFGVSEAIATSDVERFLLRVKEMRLLPSGASSTI